MKQVNIDIDRIIKQITEKGYYKIELNYSDSVSVFVKWSLEELVIDGVLISTTVTRGFLRKKKYRVFKFR